MAADNAELKRKIEATKALVKNKYSICSVAAKKLAAFYDELVKADENREIKNNSKSVARYAKAESEFKLSKREYLSFVAIFDELVEEVKALYEELIAVESPRAGRKLGSEASKFEMRMAVQRDKLLERVRTVDISDSEYEQRAKDPTPPTRDEFPAEERHEKRYEATAPQRDTSQYHTPHAAQFYPPYDMYRPYPPQGVSIAPASIDISGVVEDAVNTAMQKFKAVFEKRANEYVASMPDTVSQESAPIEAPVGKNGEAILEMESDILEGERSIMDRLLALIANMKELSERMTELGASYMQLSNAQSDAAEAQKKVNDMQRATVREIQGVQVNQKLINQEQAAVTGEQAALIEQQKANLENQKLIEAAFAEIAEMQKSLAEAQSAVSESERELIASQKGIISSVQSALNASAKNVELQRELTERQNEATALQKSAMSEHKSIFRELRRVTQKRMGEKKAATEAEAIVEASAEAAVEAPVENEAAEAVTSASVSE